MSFRALFLLALAAPIIGQNESEPYFALSTNRTFGPQGKPAVGLSAWNVKELEFRIYRINDATKFFEQLASPHQFGGRAAAPARERTWIERLHAWKHNLRTNIRLTLRHQFTESPSAHFEKLLPTASTPTASKGTRYAEAPLLNSQQLVMTFIQPVSSANRWDTTTIPIRVPDKGVFLVEAVKGDLRAYTLLMVSDLVMVTKAGRDRMVTFLADRNTGAPVADVPVRMIPHGGKAVDGTSNADGLAEFPIGGAKLEDVRIVARKGADVAVSTLESYAFSAAHEQWTGYVYTDRPVYRPGHPMHFKGILRVKAATGYDIPAGRQVSVEIRNPEQKPVYQKTLTTTANGTVQDDLTLAPNAALGSYFIEIRAGEGYMNGNFEVQEYKKPEYEVRVTTTKTRVLQGESVAAQIEARYYFGEPVSGAKVKYSIYRTRYWFPMWYEPDEDAEPQQADQAAGSDFDDSDQLEGGEGVLDGEGKLTIQVPTRVSDHHMDHRYRIEAQVIDDAKREISGTGWLLATYASFVLNVQPNRYFYAPGAKASFAVEARDYDSKPVQTRVHVELQRYTYHGDKTEVKGSADVTTGADGKATAELQIPAQGGSYRVRVTGFGQEKREIESLSYLWISGRQEYDYGGPERRTVDIVPDKKSYRPGDIAKVLIMAGQPGTTVLVSVEGRDLHTTKVLRATADSTVVFEVPVTADDEPEMWISAQFIRKGEMYQSARRLRVPPEEHKLNVKVATDKPQYQPGQSANYTLDVSDNSGKPVPRAEFSLGVVDEAIYAIRPDTMQDMVSFFFGHEYNSVFTSNSLDYYFNGEAGKRRMQLAGLRPASKLAQLKPERLVKPKTRKLFPDTAFWNPVLTTDANGKATARVALPDTLTTWRATARGIAPGNKVGSATLKTIVRKNLILRLAVPRFFTQGDEVVISALVHNYLTSEKKVRVSLTLKGLDVLDGKTQDVTIASRGEVRVDWRVRAQTVRGATVHGEALTDQESDALELELPVNPPGMKLGVSKGGSLKDAATAEFSLTFPGGKVAPGSRSLSLQTSNSIAGPIFNALAYLTAFPYGCVEQTMSSFLPNIIVREAIQKLNVKSNVDDAVLQQKIRAGLDRLYGFQHPDGGWGWWETDETHPFMTAYVVAGLVQAKAAGVQVNEDSIKNGAAWLVKNVDTRWAPDLRAYMAYTLAVAGQKPPALPELAKLSPYGLALAGMIPGADREAIARLIEQRVQQNDEEAWWPVTRDDMLDFSSDTTPEATAYAMKFLSQQHPSSPLLPKAALWLMNHRNEGYWWSSTKQTAMVIYGMIEYLKASNELNSSVTAAVYVNGQKIDAPYSLDESKLAPGENKVKIVTSGQGRLYYSARAEHYSTEEKLQRTGTVSLNLLRDYFTLIPSKDGDKIVYDTAPLNGPVTSGDVIAVRLTVTGTDWRYLLIEDPIPAGTEFIEKDNLFQLKNKPPGWAYGFTRRELHDDRMAIFQTRFEQGQQQYFYLLKVVNPGLFQVGPARVQPMYQPGFLATSESRKLEVK